MVFTSYLLRFCYYCKSVFSWSIQYSPLCFLNYQGPECACRNGQDGLDQNLEGLRLKKEKINILFFKTGRGVPSYSNAKKKGIS